MKRSTFFTALIAMALVAGCSSISVNYDYDPGADFSKYKSYAWITQPTNMSGNARQAQAQSGLLAKRIRHSVDTQMSQEGFLKVTERPDLLIVFHTGVQDKVQVTDWGYGYGPYGGWRGGGGGMDVYQYQQGTLIVDLVDAQTKQLVWRGTASGVLSSSNPSPEQQQQTLDGVMAKMFKNYPPKK